LAVFLFSFTPPVLAHAGLATTDMACAAMLGAVFLAGCALLERPSLRQAVVFGVLGGLAVLTKFSVLPYFPACAALALVWYWATARPGGQEILRAAKSMAPLLGLSAAIAALLVWAGYRFSWAHGVPAPEFWAGIREVANHNSHGHWSYLLGQVNQTGYWVFFPIAIAVKTPLGILLLALAGTWVALRSPAAGKKWLPVAFVAGIMAVAMPSNINIGIRHVLPVYLGIALLGAVAVERAWGATRPAKWIQVTTAALLLWVAASSLLSHPDYLAYFNEAAGSQPEKILAESDLDWGQDVTRLGRRLHELGARQVTFIPNDELDFKRQPGFEGIQVSDTMSWAFPAPGWNAVPLTLLKVRRLGFYDTHPELQLWPNVIPPRERVGKSILLWYVPPGAGLPPR